MPLGRTIRVLTALALGAALADAGATGARAEGRELTRPPRPGDARPATVTIVEDGEARLPIAAGSSREAADELRDYLERISGATFEMVAAGRDAPLSGALYVGLAKDFPRLELVGIDRLGPEGFLLKSDERNVYVIAREPPGVRHAVATFLRSLGCRWFFPGRTWEVVPERRTLTGSWSERQSPSFPTQRRIWYGYGAYRQGREDREAWNRHNRMGGPMDVSIGHTWHGIDPERDFEAHPDWFSLVDGRRQPSKPCYSHPEVQKRAVDFALKRAAAGGRGRMVSMTPPDGLGYCECGRCRAVFQGGEPFEAHRTLFARRPDGTLVNITSETVFAFVNRVAEAVAEKHPQTLVGCYAYSAYSHPPSFELHPNVYLQTTTAFRRTPIPLEEQLRAFGRKTRRLGIREYYSAFQWDWDYPDPGKVTPDRLQEDLRFFQQSGVTAVNAEASNNWAPRGLGYYVAAHLMWDVDADVEEIVRDFYEKAFGPAARVMERYYVRWYGPGAAVSRDPDDLPRKRTYFEEGRHDLAALKEAYRDLDAAARLVDGRARFRERIDHLKMYLHYLLLRYRLEEAARDGERERILEAIRDETVFGGRLADTHMIHARPLIGKAFLRRFRAFEPLLETVPEARRHGRGWRRIGKAPTPEELDRLWADDKATLGLGPR